MNGNFYVLRGGIPWRLRPKNLPPKNTVYGYFNAWRDSGLFAGINHHLVMSDREPVGQEASPSAAALDGQSVSTTESGGPRVYDAGQKVQGRKRQALVDTDGRALMLDPQPADVQNRDGAVPVLKQSRRTGLGSPNEALESLSKVLRFVDAVQLTRPMLGKSEPVAPTRGLEGTPRPPRLLRQPLSTDFERLLRRKPDAGRRPSRPPHGDIWDPEDWLCSRAWVLQAIATMVAG